MGVQAAPNEAGFAYLTERVPSKRHTHTVDGQNPALKKPWNDGSPFTYQQAQAMVSKRCRNSSIHSMSLWHEGCACPFCLLGNWLGLLLPRGKNTALHSGLVREILGGYDEVVRPPLHSCSLLGWSLGTRMRKHMRDLLLRVRITWYRATWHQLSESRSNSCCCHIHNFS